MILNVLNVGVFAYKKSVDAVMLRVVIAAVVNAASGDYLNICILCNVKLKQHNGTLGREFMAAVNAIPEVTECYNISGDFDYMLKIYVRDMKHYEAFVLDSLGAIPSVGSLQSNFVMSVVKQSPEIPI